MFLKPGLLWTSVRGYINNIGVIIIADSFYSFFFFFLSGIHYNRFIVLCEPCSIIFRWIQHTHTHTHNCRVQKLCCYLQLRTRVKPDYGALAEQWDGRLNNNSSSNNNNNDIGVCAHTIGQRRAAASVGVQGPAAEGLCGDSVIRPFVYNAGTYYIIPVQYHVVHEW